jgi:hypothetical protein
MLRDGLTTARSPVRSDAKGLWKAISKLWEARKRKGGGDITLEKVKAHSKDEGDEDNVTADTWAKRAALWSEASDLQRQKWLQERQGMVVSMKGASTRLGIQEDDDWNLITRYTSDTVWASDGPNPTAKERICTRDPGREIQRWWNMTHARDMAAHPKQGAHIRTCVEDGGWGMMMQSGPSGPKAKSRSVAELVTGTRLTGENMEGFYRLQATIEKLEEEPASTVEDITNLFRCRRQECEGSPHTENEVHVMTYKHGDSSVEDRVRQAAQDILDDAGGREDLTKPWTEEEWQGWIKDQAWTLINGERMANGWDTNRQKVRSDEVTRSIRITAVGQARSPGDEDSNTMVMRESRLRLIWQWWGGRKEKGGPEDTFELIVVSILKLSALAASRKETDRNRSYRTAKGERHERLPDGRTKLEQNHWLIRPSLLRLLAELFGLDIELFSSITDASEFIPLHCTGSLWEAETFDNFVWNAFLQSTKELLVNKSSYANPQYEEEGDHSDIGNFYDLVAEVMGMARTVEQPHLEERKRLGSILEQARKESKGQPRSKTTRTIIRGLETDLTQHEKGKPAGTRILAILPEGGKAGGGAWKTQERVESSGGEILCRFPRGSFSFLSPAFTQARPSNATRITGRDGDRLAATEPEDKWIRDEFTQNQRGRQFQGDVVLALWDSEMGRENRKIKWAQAKKGLNDWTKKNQMRTEERGAKIVWGRKLRDSTMDTRRRYTGRQKGGGAPRRADIWIGVDTRTTQAQLRGLPMDETRRRIMIGTWGHMCSGPQGCSEGTGCCRQKATKTTVEIARTTTDIVTRDWRKRNKAWKEAVEKEGALRFITSEDARREMKGKAKEVRRHAKSSAEMGKKYGTAEDRITETNGTIEERRTWCVDAVKDWLVEKGKLK